MKKINNKKTGNKRNKKDFIKILIPLIVIIAIAYVIYRIAKLIALPIDMFMVEEGTIIKEERVIRICNKR